MAKNKKRTLLRRLFGFFLPTKVRSIKGFLWFCFSRFTLFFVCLTLLFKVLPVPYSAYMVQQKVSHLLSGESYSIKHKWVNLDKIAWQMQVAVIASEDQKFKDHFGIDVNAIELALKRNVKSNKVRGASTISQQTVKNLFLWSGRSWIRKGVELPLTLLVEGVWSKKRILEVYLNIAEFGKGIFGVEAAARHFFHKSAKNLNSSEAALLAASLPNPLEFKVNRAGPIMRKKQRWIMQQMRSLGGRDYLKQLK